MKAKKAFYPSAVFVVVGTLICMLAPFSVIAQAKSSWEASAHAGTSSISGDVLARTGFGGGFSLKKNLGKVFGLRIDYTGSVNKGLDAALRTTLGINDNSPNDPYHFYFTRLNKPFVANYKAAVHQFSLNGVLDIFTYKIPGSTSQLSGYGSLGYSFIMADTDIDIFNAANQNYDFTAINYGAGKREVRNQLKLLLDENYENNAYYKNRKQANDKNIQYYHGANVSVGTHYAINSTMGVAAEYRFTTAFTDLLDGIKTAGKNDFIHYISLRGTYSFGRLAGKSTKRINVDGSKSIYTSVETVSTVDGFVEPSIQGQATIKGSDTSYFLNFSFKPIVPANVTNSQMIFLKLEDKSVVMLPFAGVPRAVKMNEVFTFRTKLSRDQVIALANAKATDIKIETSTYALEGKIQEAKQSAIAYVCKQLIKE